MKTEAPLYRKTRLIGDLAPDGLAAEAFREGSSESREAGVFGGPAHPAAVVPAYEHRVVDKTVEGHERQIPPPEIGGEAPAVFHIPEPSVRFVGSRDREEAVVPLPPEFAQGARLPRVAGAGQGVDLGLGKEHSLETHPVPRNRAAEQPYREPVVGTPGRDRVPRIQRIDEIHGVDAVARPPSVGLPPEKDIYIVCIIGQIQFPEIGFPRGMVARPRVGGPFVAAFKAAEKRQDIAPPERLDLHFLPQGNRGFWIVQGKLVARFREPSEQERIGSLNRMQIGKGLSVRKGIALHGGMGETEPEEADGAGPEQGFHAYLLRSCGRKISSAIGVL